jgi:hypothetical protein
LPSMRRFGPIFRPVPVAGGRRANSTSSGSPALLAVSREDCLGASWRGFQQSTSQLAMTKMQKQVSIVSPVKRQSFIRSPWRAAAAVLSPVVGLQLSRQLLNAAVRHCEFMPWAANSRSLPAMILAQRRSPDFIVRRAPSRPPTLVAKLGSEERY